MKLINPRGLLLSIFVLGVCLTPATDCFSQAQPVEKPAEGSQQVDLPSIRVYELNYLDPETALQTIEQFVGGESLIRSSILDHENKFIVAGDAGAHQRIVELLRQIDQEQVEPARGVKIFRARNRNSSDLADMVASLLPEMQRDGLRLTTEPNSNSLVVAGTAAELEAVDSLIRTLDQSVANQQESVSPSENVVVRITWLVDSESLKSLKGPQANLKKLAAGLQQSGLLHTVATLTQMQSTVQVQSSNQRPSRFSNVSSRKLDDKHVTMTCEALVNPTTDGQYQIEIDLGLDTGSDARQNIGSTITLPKNHPVAFSVSDVGEFKSAVVVELLDAG